MESQQVIAVTGASRGIGAAIALELARRGQRVGCLTRKGRGIEREAIDPALAARMIAIRCDVESEASVKQAFAALLDKAGRIDGLVNNAGLHLDGKSAELPTATFDRIMNVNARSVFVCAREVYPHLEKHGGTIVNIGSFFDKMGVRRNLAYCASKAAVGAITRCLAVEWAPKKIRVLDVAPGYIATELNAAQMKGPLAEFLKARVPVGGPGSADEVARLVATLFAEDLPFLTGETIYIDGAQGMAH
ncbi:MAG: short-chain dehydrogenase [Betaproteobacteria bacterium SG8_39]|nr:MAG: short-chain dehydrogenase [Betaproteobacteria bacterium SG8_39]